MTNPRSTGEGGASLITSILGTFFVLATVFAGVETLVTMHRRTIVTGVADDLAHRLARDETLDSAAEASKSAASLGRGVMMQASTTGDDITVTVSARGPGLLRFAPFKTFNQIRRTVTARREVFQTNAAVP